MLHSRRLLYINEIARCGSIRKAAARLNVASSAINRQILALEEEMGAPLFERLPRGLRLTAAGELCIEHIREVLKNYERLEGRIRSLKMQQAGKVRIVATVGLAAGPLPEIIARFLLEHPRVFIQLRNDAGSTTMAPVVAGEVDIGLGFNIPATPGIRSLGNFDIPIGVVLPPGHPLIGPGPINLADVVEERLLLAQPGSSLRDIINLTLARLSVQVEPVLESNASEMLKQLVKCGAGLTLLNPLDVITECRRGELVFRPIAEPHSRPQPMKLFARTRAPLDAATSLFAEYLLAELAGMVEELHAKGHIIAPSERRRSDTYFE
ncbi:MULTISPECIES: LysR substrate-binding domain-containing protein [Rhizobium]|uniref:HTH-type transcriptional regulator TtuA n=1 Tax=Rhizobium tropici TaxID=398 RepID=A0A329Y185_RHITR|nr:MULTISPECIES: LysR substrate-binding domain-containing protein [Rhizobium]MBB3286942.1 DNA-binding transcriptional LysR family regulator [Rhizobium sp. BK252]MBB3401682.1 DNA-binding transcriptional LysR family regulator [Rhizobium sp. BK289]MBB3414374.1 DNA-binding transcriptional LysR family regulator [Rhizobium sp. BK284]MBB3482262.1 DNA-binding transcriptional LysR family regulator [Rhizobium sp. BK347]MDK4718438.1 LysR substrate-binding domain-containing protein [Rhizobium sp. CNPSo 39